MDGNSPLDPVRSINRAQLGAETVATAVLAHYGAEKAPEVYDELARQADETYRQLDDLAMQHMNAALVYKRWARDARAARIQEPR